MPVKLPQKSGRQKLPLGGRRSTEGSIGDLPDNIVLVKLRNYIVVPYVAPSDIARNYGVALFRPNRGCNIGLSPLNLLLFTREWLCKRA